MIDCESVAEIRSSLGVCCVKGGKAHFMYLFPLLFSDIATNIKCKDSNRANASKVLWGHCS